MSVHRDAADVPAEQDELVRLAEDLHAAIAAGDLRHAKEANDALGHELDRAAAKPGVVVDLARERARRSHGR